MILVRPLSHDQVTDCVEIMLANPLWQRYGVTPTALEKRFASGLASGASILAALEEDRLLGFIWYVEKGAFQRSGYIMLVGVHPGEQGRGVGGRLMDAAEEAMFANCGEVMLLVSDFNQEARRFYARRGYKQVGCLPDYVIQGIDEMIFCKKRS